MMDAYPIPSMERMIGKVASAQCNRKESMNRKKVSIVQAILSTFLSKICQTGDTDHDCHKIKIEHDIIDKPVKLV